MDKVIQWHPAFCAAMEHYFLHKPIVLEFQKEYNLSTKPLQVDLLIIKKGDDTVLDSAIGRDFRKYNIFEYKSPDDKLNIDTLYKLTAYGCLYKADGKFVNEIKAEEITLTLMRDTCPKSLLKALEKEGKLVRSNTRGVYFITEMLFPVRIIVTGELPATEAGALKYLSRNLTKKDAAEFVKMTKQAAGEYEEILIDSIMQVSISANRQVYEEAKKEDITMCEALKDLMQEEIKAGRDEGREEGREEGRKEGREEGREEGRKEGREETIYGLVSEGDLSPEKGAQKLGVSVEQLRADMDTHGFHI